MGDVSFTAAGIVVITALLGALTTAIVALFKALMNSQAERYNAVMATKDSAMLTVVASKDTAINDMKLERDNYRRMALQATLVLENRVNHERGARGADPFDALAPVVPEHHSPITVEQQEAADFATLRARLAAAALELDEEVPELATTTAPPPGATIEIHHAVVSGVVDTSAEGEEATPEHTIIEGATITGVVAAPEGDSSSDKPTPPSGSAG